MGEGGRMGRRFRGWLGLGLLAAALACLGCLTWTEVRLRLQLSRASEAYQVGRYGTALSEIQELLKIRPEEPRGLALAARCLIRIDRLDEAEKAFRRAGSLGLDDQRLRARALLRAGRLDAARPVLEEILRLQPDDPDAIQRLAAIHHARGEYVLAERLAEKLVKNPRTEIIGQTLIGTIHHDLASQRVETPGAAIRAFERVLELDPGLRQVPIQPPRQFWDFYARDLIAEGRTADARKHLEQVLAGGDDAGLLDLLGQTYWADGRLDEARRCWERSLELDPSRSDPWIELGRLALRQGRLDEAVNRLTRAVELSPQSFNPLYNLIQAHRRLGNNQEADRLQVRLEQLRAADPSESRRH